MPVMSRRPAAHVAPLRRSLSVLALAVVASVALLGIGVPAASAHDALTAATPADGAAVETAPADVVLEFSGVVQELGARVEVTGPDGTAVSTGDPEVVDRTLTQALSPDLPAGTYTADWRVTSADGHPISGTTSFTVTTGDPAAGSAPPVREASSTEPADESSSGLWIGIGAGAVLLVALGVGARQLRGRP